MKSICTAALLLLMGSALGQNQKDLSIQYHSDGGKTIIDNDGKERVTMKFNADGLCIFSEVQIIGSPRVIRDEYVYDHKHRIVETIDYSHSSGYSKDVITLNDQGLETSFTKYESVDKHKKGNWKIVTQRTHAYDNQNRVIRFESKMIPARWQHEHYHKIDEMTYQADGTVSSLKKQLDANGRVIKQTTSRSKGRGPCQPEKSNIVGKMTQTPNGFMVLTQTAMYKYETYYENNRIVKENFYKSNYGYNDIDMSRYKLRYTFDYKYRNGMLTEQVGMDGEKLRSKRLIEYEGGAPVRFKRFYRPNDGSMKMAVKQGFTPAHEQYFPELKRMDRSNSDLSMLGGGSNESADQMESAPQSSQNTEYDPPSYQAPTDFSGTDYGIIEKLEETPKLSISSENVHLDRETQALLDQIRMLANSNSNQEISEAQIMHLALQQLVAQHRNELKELNQKHLENQQSMFD